MYYTDATPTSQWVDAAGPSVAVQATAPTGYEGQLWLDSTDGSMYTYYTDPGGTASSWIGAVSRSGGILQVVSTTKTDTFTNTSTTFTDITGLSATITPRSTSSKILILAQLSVGLPNNAGGPYFRLTGGNSENYVGDAASNRSRVVHGGSSNVDLSSFLNEYSIQYLDSPSTTSSITYKVQTRQRVSTPGTGYINRTAADSDSESTPRGVSSITLIEVAG